MQAKYCAICGNRQASHPNSILALAAKGRLNSIIAADKAVANARIIRGFFPSLAPPILPAKETIIKAIASPVTPGVTLRVVQKLVPYEPQSSLAS